MTVIGMWLAIVGYGLAYSGYVQLGGGRCSLLDGFRGRCSIPGARTSAATAGSPGVTMLGVQQAQAQQQANMITTLPIQQPGAGMSVA